MKNTPTTLKHILSVITIVMVAAIIAGSFLLFQEKTPAPTDPPVTDPTIIDPPGLDIEVQGYLFNEDRTYLDRAALTATGPALTELITGKNTPFDLIEVTGFPDIVTADGCAARIKDHKNNIQEITIEKITPRRNYETGEIVPLFMEVRYSIYIDRTSSAFLMCTINVGESDSTFYLTKSMHPSSITDVLNQAYIE